MGGNVGLMKGCEGCKKKQIKEFVKAIQHERRGCDGWQEHENDREIQ